MKRIVSLAIMATLCSYSFAAAPTSSANKSSSFTSSASSAWKSYRTLQPKQHKNDMEIVYGGEDIKNPALIQTAQA